MVAKWLAMEVLVESREASFTKGQELRSFLFLSIIMAPLIAGAVIAAYGFLVWMFQLLGGPPGS